MKHLAILFALLLCAVSLESQISPGALHRLIGNPATAGNNYPAGIPALSYWWVASDLTTGTLVTNWVDRVQSNAMTSGGSKRPTVTTNGVYFDGVENMLTNQTGISFSNNSTHFFIMYETASGDLSTVNWGAPLIAFRSTSSLCYYTNGFLMYNFTGAAGTWCDLAYLVDSSLPRSYGYLNGVLKGTNNAAFSATFKNYFGCQYTSWQGYIREILIYTNTLTEAQMLSLHTYATNKYSYTP